MKSSCLIWILLALGLIVGLTAELVFGLPANGTISGRIVETDGGGAIAGVLITVVGEGRQATSDKEGRFLLTGLAAGDYDLTFTLSGFETAERQGITVSNGKTTTLTIQMSRQEGRAKAGAAADAKQDIRSSTSATPKDEAIDGSEQKKSERRNAAPQVSAEMYGRTDSYTDNRYSTTDYLRQVPKESPRDQEYYPQPYPDDMTFRDYGTNRFVDTRRDHLSTFGLDVDDASYTVARSYLLNGQLPPTEAIRIEEFINHFDYGYNTPDQSKFRVFTEMTGSPFERNVTLLKLGIKGQEISDWERKPLNLTLVIDVSGSMNYGNRIDLLKQSLTMLIEQLDRNDRIGIVAYGSKAFTVLEPTSGDNKRVILKSLNRLQPGGSTYAEAGIRLGYEMANDQFVRGHSNLVVLCSDGVANVGQTDPDAIMRDIKQHVRNGITLSTFGFGMGNYNDVLLERLAINGNGKYAYIDNEDQARKLFVDGLVGTLHLLARDVKVQVDFNPNVVSEYRLLGYENRAIADNKFRDNRQDGGEVGAGHEVTALYELVLTQAKPTARIATVFVRWKDADHPDVVELSRDITAGKGILRFESARAELRLAVVASRFAEMLKETRYSESTGYDDLARLARSIERQLPGDQTRELADLIERAGSLAGYYSDNDRSREDRDYRTDMNYKR